MDKNEGNKLIAEFMGMEETNIPGFFNTTGDEFLSRFWVGSVPYDKVMFDKSWDWLMPCIKKIREILNTELSVNDYDNWRYLQVALNPFNYDIDFIHSKVVVFIQWYNSQKQ